MERKVITRFYTVTSRWIFFGVKPPVLSGARSRQITSDLGTRRFPSAAHLCYNTIPLFVSDILIVFGARLVFVPFSSQAILLSSEVPFKRMRAKEGTTNRDWDKYGFERRYFVETLPTWYSK